MKFKNIKIRIKLLIGYLSTFAIAALVGVIGFGGMDLIMTQQKVISDIILPSVHSLSIIDEAQTAIIASENALLVSGITPELMEDAYKRIDDAKVKAANAWKIYIPLPKNASESDVLKECLVAWDEWWIHHEKVMELAKKHNINRTAQSYNSLSYNVLTVRQKPYIKSERLLMQLIEINDKLAVEASLKAVHENGMAQLSLTIALLIGFIVALVFGYLISKSIRVPLAKCVKLADAVAKGDLTYETDIYQEDEIGQLTKSLEIMVLNLKKITTEIKNGVNVLGTSSSEILTTVTEISTGAAETATSVSETTTTVEEVRQTTMVSNQKAQSLMMSSQKAGDSVEKGRESINEVILSMKKIENQMNLISDTVIKLAEQNRTIGEITSSVADIADQSNLLAVNAAIEAAKAGEHGRGFTVVAQEIRSLADQSKKATAQVKEILNEINKSVNQAVGVTEQGSRTVEEGRRLVALSGEVIELLAENVEETAQASIQISSSNQQQMAGMEQIVPAMENIKMASEHNVSGIKQAQAAAHDLNALGQNLKQLIEKFKI